MINLENLLRIPYVDVERGYDISPDGKHLAFSWNVGGHWDIYELSLDYPSKIQKISDGDGANFSPDYAPDGNSIAYVTDKVGNEAFDIHIYDRSCNRSTNLTPNTIESIQPALSWSPNGKQIAFISNRSGNFSTYIMPILGGTALPIFSRSQPDMDVAWSPDGQKIAISSESSAQDKQTTIVTVDGFACFPLTWNQQVLNTRDACWSPDGKRLAFSSDQAGRFNIAIYEIDSGQISWVTCGAGDKYQPDWSPDGSCLVFVHSQDAEAWLEICTLDDGYITRFQAIQGVHHHPRFLPGGNGIITIVENPACPPDLWLLSLFEGSFHQLTYSLPTTFDASNLILPSHIWYSGMDGRQVPSLLFHPKKLTDLCPAVIVIHGGPDWAFQSIWYPLMAHMASRGWVILAPNYRGSTGYGREWQLANRYDLGGIDMQDIVAGAQYLVQAKLADPKHIAITGRSHGGYLTMTCLTRFPQLWACGSAVVPFINWFTSHEASREDLKHWDIENMGDPKDNYARWYDRSPFFFLEHIQAPVQLICGANDTRCPASESIAAQSKLKSLGKQVEFILYPDEGHEFLKIENIVDQELRRITFLSSILEQSQR